jgi:transcriptional regulator with XRE-family HTH domain
MVGKRIAVIRGHRGMTQSDLAPAIGVSRSVIDNIENGRTRLSLARAVRIAEALHCSIDDLLAPPAAPVSRARSPGRRSYRRRSRSHTAPV